MELSPQIRTFEKLPSSTEFESLIESANVPAVNSPVFKSCVCGWKAFSLWGPSNGGLDYLQGRVGSCVVEAMLSKSAPAFYGDLRSHERVQLPFSDFVGFCQRRMRKCDDEPSRTSCESESERICNWLPRDDALKQIYLAQVPIMHFEDEDKVQLGALKDDIDKPVFLEERDLASVNLWMNSAESRSSTHYDPHHNLLCVVAGRKQVVLWSPSASPMLYPMPVYGEAPNHSLISLENSDYSVYPRAKRLMEFALKVTLSAGDALFIPEGWFHQVDSDELTIAVNFWWQSSITSGMSEHMDAYYLRRILRRLADREMSEILSHENAPSTEIRSLKKDTCELLDSSCGKPDEACEKQGSKVKELEPVAIQALHELVSLVHERINVAGSRELVQSSSTTNPAVIVEAENSKVPTSNSLCLQDDVLTKILWSLEPCTLQNVFLAMANNFPRTLEALILHLLSPVAAEVLTRKFEELDRLITEEERNNFYRVFYGAFDNQFDAMDAILNRKESFAQQEFFPSRVVPALPAFNSVLEKHLGVKCIGSMRGMR